MTLLAKKPLLSAARATPPLSEVIARGSLRDILAAIDPETSQGRSGLMTLSDEAQAAVAAKMQRWFWLLPFWFLSPWQVLGAIAVPCGLVVLCAQYLPAQARPWGLLLVGACAALGLLVATVFAYKRTSPYRLLVREPTKWLMAAVLAQRSNRAGAYLRIVQSNRERLWVADAIAIDRIAGEHSKGHIETWAWHTLLGPGYTTTKAPLAVIPSAGIND